MTKEEMTIEAARAMMEHGPESPRRTDIVWKIKIFMRVVGLGSMSPAELLTALDVAGLKIEHADAVGTPGESK